VDGLRAVLPKETAATAVAERWGTEKGRYIDESLGLVSTFPVYDIFQRYAFQVTCQVFTE
jgi:hypothetical protein